MKKKTKLILEISISFISCLILICLIIIIVNNLPKNVLFKKECCICGVSSGNPFECCVCPPHPNSELCFHRPEHEDCQINIIEDEK